MGKRIKKRSFELQGGIMKNVYERCPTYETQSFLLRLVKLEDAEDLLVCYSDKDNVSKFNADFCTSDFYYPTVSEMEDCIRFWLEEYQKQYYVRFSVVGKTEGKSIGTVEIFGGEAGVLRIDLSSKHNTEKSFAEILKLTIEQFIDDFEIASVKIKTSNIPEKINCIESFGFIPSKTYRTESGYHEYNI